MYELRIVESPLFVSIMMLSKVHGRALAGLAIMKQRNREGIKIIHALRSGIFAVIRKLICLA